MNIIVRYLLRSIGENRLRTALIVLAISLSSALFFATSGLGSTIEATYTRVLETEFGLSHIMIRADRNSPSPFVSPRNARQLADRTAWITQAISGSGRMAGAPETDPFQIRGMSVSDMEQMSPFATDRPLLDSSFQGRQIVLSRPDTEELGLRVGDWLQLEIGGNPRPVAMQLAAVAEPVGYFHGNSGSIHALIPFDTAASLFGTAGRAGTVFVRAREESERFSLEAALQELYPRVRVQQTILPEERAEFANTVVIPFRIMLFLVIAVSVFIIYSTFQVITAERLPTVGTFRSIGATRRMVTRVLYGEAVAYGVLGAALGLLLGVLILNGMTAVAARGFGRAASGARATFGLQDAVGAIAMALFLPVMSAAIPIHRVAKIPVKDVILQLHSFTGGSKDRTVSGAGLLALGAILPATAPANAILVWYFVGLVCTFIGTVFVIPFFTRSFVRLLQYVYHHAFGNIGRLAAMNLRDNGGIINNIVLLCIGITGVFLITTISGSVAEQAGNLYRNARFDLEIHGGARSAAFERRLLHLPEVQDTYGHFIASNVQIPTHSGRIRRVMGIYPDRFQDFWRFEYSEAASTLLPRLNDGRTVIVSYTLRERYGLTAGDTIDLAFNRRVASYTVIGFVSTLWSNGDMAMISERFLRQDHGAGSYNALYVVATRDPYETQAAIAARFGHEGYWSRTVSQIAQRGRDSNQELFFLLQGFSLMAMLLGTVGVVNNFIISFLDRKRSFALFRSTGMSGKQLRRMLFIEAATVGAVGASAGLMVAGLMLQTIPLLLESFRVFIPLEFPPLTALGMIGAGILIAVTASVGPAMRTRRMNIIEALKYE